MAKKDLVAAKPLKIGGKVHAPGDPITADTQSKIGDKALKAAIDAGQVVTGKEYDAAQMNDAARETLDAARKRADAAEAKIAELEEKIAELEAAAEGNAGGGTGGGGGLGV